MSFHPLSALTQQQCVKAAKRALRAQQLATLKKWAKQSPTTLESESHRLCMCLHAFLCGRYGLPPISSSAVSTPFVGSKNGGEPRLDRLSPTSGSLQCVMKDSSHSGRDHILFLCSYLPLFFEANLQLLLQQFLRPYDPDDSIFAGREDCASHHRRVCVMVPVIVQPYPKKAKADRTEHRRQDQLTDADGYREHHYPTNTASARLQSAMLFVEVHDLRDLETSFEPTGPYQIRELKADILATLFHRRGQPAQAVTLPQPSTPPRRVIACAEWEELFPEHLPPPCLVRRPCSEATADMGGDEGSNPTAGLHSPSSMVVCVPGVCFSISGARLGKGGGFYDRFLHYHQHLAASTGAALGYEAHPNRVEKPELLVVGIAFEEQLVDHHAVPVAAQQDVHMDLLATPRACL